jgi:hypothetical protein
MKQILLNSSKNNTDVNVESAEYISLSTKQREVPTEQVQGIINHYELYLSERNNCKNYKMIFTLHPYMSNVLFNAFTEIVYNEGAIQSGIIGYNTKMNEKHSGIVPLTAGNEVSRKAFKGDNFVDRRYQLIRDTEFSHENLGNLEYHCGLDIFNNHYLRSDGFFGIKKTDENTEVFNTIEDYMVYQNGTIATHYRETPGTAAEVSKTGRNWWERLWDTEVSAVKRTVSKLLYGDAINNRIEKPSHLFNHENIKPLMTAFSEGIKDNNGWVGFYNRAYLPIKNVNGNIVNRCINNRKSCDFIDMYPDRTLFSLLPKINSRYNSREEYNWKWFLTYPYENTTVDIKGNSFDFFDFFDGDKGLKIIWNSKSPLLYNNNVENGILRENRMVYFRTKAKHNLKVGDSIKLTHDNGACSLRVLGVGDEYIENKEYYFSVSYDDLADELGEKSVEVNDVSVFYVEIPSNLYIAKLKDGYPCKYYIRKFKKIKDVSSVLNKMAFSRTIYNDNIVQIMYNETINIDGLRDNLGREVSEVYLTLVKTNKGKENYYISGNTNPFSVEFSHCFGRVTSGFNFEVSDNEIDKVSPTSESGNFQFYNVRSMYNLENFGGDDLDLFRKTMGIPFSPPKVCEEDITDNNDVFYGDFVEFSIADVSETVIETVYHRFNTAQRETKLVNETFNFKKFKYDEIEFDDFDFDFKEENQGAIGATEVDIPEFTVETIEGFRQTEEDSLVDNTNDVGCDNIFPEGYFYKPHYKVKLKEYSNIVSFDYDTIIAYGEVDLIKPVSNRFGYYEFTTAGNIPYAFTNEDKIVVLYTDGTYKVYYIDPLTRGSKVVFRDLYYENKEVKTIFYKNPNIPEYAFYLPDGTGKYVWRELIKDTELTQDSDIYNRTYANGAVYINTNINFYVRRQDPFGIYGLKYTNKSAGMASDFIVNGVSIELPDIDYKIEENYLVCEN